MKLASLLLAVLVLPVHLLATNLLEMRYALPMEQPGAIKAAWGTEPLWLAPDIVINQDHVQEAKAAADENNPGLWLVVVKLTAEGTKRFDDEASKHQGDQLAILVKGKVVSAPVMRASKFGGVLNISGVLTTQKEAQELATALSSGLKK
ncbi:MAG: hypothetical protein NTY98_22360 [Verrucomicrobia bacterium]|nr:hypothetical protein [Verrucomicrobiota bacterium]